MIESLTYRRPRALILSIVVLLVAGLSALSVIGRQEDPSITNIFAMVRTPFPGADPAKIEKTLTIPLEERLRQIPEIDLIESLSSPNFSVIALELVADVDPERIENIWAEVRDELEEAQQTYPIGALASELDINVAGTFAAIIAVSGDHENVPPSVIARYARDLAGELRVVPGTKLVQLFGEPEEEVRVELDPGSLSALGLSIADLSHTIRAAEGNGSAGRFENAQTDLQVGLDNPLATPAKLRDIPIQAPRAGGSVRLGSLAEITRATRHPTTLGLHNAKDAVLVGARPQDGLRIDHWLEQVKDATTQYNARVPGGLTVELIFDQSHYTSLRLRQVSMNLLLGFVLVAMVLSMTIGRRAAFVVAATVPLVGLATIASMNSLGIPLHQMSITGIIVALGLVVDANIVMVDQICRQLEKGKRITQAIILSVRRLVVPLFASTATTALAFTPMLLLPGPSGDFISAIAAAVILMLGWSLIVSLVITPGLAGHILRLGHAQTLLPTDAGAKATRVASLLERGLTWAFRRPGLAMPLALAVPLSGFALVPFAPIQFFPGTDRDQFQIEIHMPPGVSIDRTRAAALELDAELRALDEVESVTWMVGRGVPVFYYNVNSQEGSTPHYAQAMVITKSPEATAAILPDLQMTLGHDMPDVQVVVKGLVQGPAVNAPIEVRLFGENSGDLRETGDLVRSAMAETPGIIGTRTTLQGGIPTIQVGVDEALSAALGLDNGAVAVQISDAINGRVSTTFREAEEQVPIRVMVRDEARSNLERLTDLIIIPPSGSRDGADPVGVPLSSFATFDLKQQSGSINRRNGKRVNVVQAFTESGALPQEIEADLFARLEHTGFILPVGVTMAAGGDSDARDGTMKDLQQYVGVIVILAIAIVVLTFSSFRLAAIAGLVCLLSVGSSLFTLSLLGLPIGIMAIIGVIGAIGVSINAAIIIITALQGNYKAVEGDKDTIVTIVVESARHIVSTTITTFAGFLPLILAGGAFWPPFAVAIAGGVLLSTVVSLAAVPLLFSMIWTTPKHAWSRRSASLA